jgi:hypothetical protein
MITDARAQVDLIAALHLEALFKMGYLESAGDQPDSQQLRHRLAVIQTLAMRARGLTLKTDMGQDESTRKNNAISRSHPQTQQEDI